MDDRSSPDSLLASLAQGMSQTLHWFPEDVPLSTLAEVLVGFANTAGGRVLIGISPRTGKVLGLANPEAALDRVIQAALLIDPALILPLPKITKVGAASLLEVHVPSGLPNVYSLDGRYLGRNDRHTAGIPPRQLRQLLIQRGTISFEGRIAEGAAINDLDQSQVVQYLQTLNLPGQVPIEEALLRRGCLAPFQTGYSPTYAGLLLFGKHPQQWVPNATILAVRFSGESFSDKFTRQDISGSLPNQLRLAEQFARDHLRSTVNLTGLTHQDTLEYPFEAIRELMVNAIAHRDYNMQGDNIHLHIFSNRLEVHSPGGLPGPINLDNLLQARFSRNPIIVQVLSDLGFVERLGYGLNRVVAVLKMAGHPAPEFAEIGGAFRVILHARSLPQAPSFDLSAYQSLNLNPRQETALTFLSQNRRITNRDYQELCPDVHAETLRRDLVALVDLGILIRIGDKRATYYILKSIP